MKIFERLLSRAGKALNTMAKQFDGVGGRVRHAFDDLMNTVSDRVNRAWGGESPNFSNPCKVGAGHSFSADTTVATENGDIAISEIEVGDEVYAYNEVTGEVGEYEVTHVHIHDDPMIVHLVIDGEIVETTPEHPFYTAEEEWVNAADLQVGDQIRNLEGEHGTLERVTVITQTETMYNLTVDEAHTFFVGDGAWLVHNTNIVCPNPMEIYGWTNRHKGEIPYHNNEGGIYEFSRGRGYKVGSTSKPIQERFRDASHRKEIKILGGMENVTYTFLDVSILPPGHGRRIMEIAERIRREQLIERGFEVYGDLSASVEAVKVFWQSNESNLIRNWPNWLIPPEWMLK